jgi:hypothetical protein
MNPEATSVTFAGMRWASRARSPRGLLKCTQLRIRVSLNPGRRPVGGRWPDHLAPTRGAVGDHCIPATRAVRRWATPSILRSFGRGLPNREGVASAGCV